jgi:hypothetical protein
LDDTCFENVEKLRRNYKLKYRQGNEGYGGMKENCSYLKNISKRGRIVFAN